MRPTTRLLRWSESTYWSWCCNSSWSGVGDSFNLSIPVQQNVTLQGMLYNPKSKQIEVWGHYSPDKNIASMYNDIQSPKTASGYGRPSGDGGAAREREPYK